MYMYIYDQVFLSLVSYKGDCESRSPASFKLTLMQAKDEMYMEKPASQKKNHHPPALDHDPPCAADLGSHLALTLLKCKHWCLTRQCFPAMATAAGR